jgi:hypothetical protein
MATVLRVNGLYKMAGEEFFTAEAQRAQRKTTYNDPYKMVGEE